MTINDQTDTGDEMKKIIADAARWRAVETVLKGTSPDRVRVGDVVRCPNCNDVGHPGYEFGTMPNKYVFFWCLCDQVRNYSLAAWHDHVIAETVRRLAGEKKDENIKTKEGF